MLKSTIRLFITEQSASSYIIQRIPTQSSPPRCLNWSILEPPGYRASHLRRHTDKISVRLLFFWVKKRSRTPIIFLLSLRDLKNQILGEFAGIRNPVTDLD